MMDLVEVLLLSAHVDVFLMYPEVLVMKMEWEEMVAHLSLMNGKIPDRHRAESLARELYEEMEACKWIINGKPVANPAGLLVKRLKDDGAYRAKGA